MCVCVVGSSPKTLQVGGLAPQRRPQMPGSPKQETSPYPGKRHFPASPSLVPWEKPPVASAPQAIAAADLRASLLPAPRPQLLPAPWLSGHTHTLGGGACPGFLFLTDHLQMKPASVGGKHFISILTSLDDRERQLAGLCQRRASLSRPRGNYHYLILRESVWLCLHLAEAGCMLCLMLSLLLSTTAGDEEPFITTSALEGEERGRG